MTTITLLKLAGLIAIFVATGVPVLKQNFLNKHPIWIVMSAIVGLIGSYYLSVSIYNDFKFEPSEKASTTAKSHKQRTSLTRPPDELQGELRKGPAIATATLRFGETWNKWTYQKVGSDFAELVHASKKTQLLVRFPQYETPEVKIYSQDNSAWIAVVGQDIDGNETTHYVNQKNMSVIFARDDAKRVYWSPSIRYIISLGGGEVDFFGILDTMTGVYTRSDGLHNDINPLFVVSEPLWGKTEDYFLVTVSESSNDRMTTVDTGMVRVDIPSLSATYLNR